MGKQRSLDQEGNPAFQTVHYSTRAREKEKSSQMHLSDDDSVAAFNSHLANMGLMLREIKADGNCLFRALGDQLEGHTRNHLQHRQDVMHYMKEHRQDFEPFVEDDITFDKHVENLSQPGTHAGNDALVAFARLHGINIVIHQLNSPLWQIKGTNQDDAREIHLCYHSGEHFSSVRKQGDFSERPANIHLSSSIKSLRNLERNTEDVYLDIADIEQQIIEATGCQDLEFIHQVLKDNCYDVNAAVDSIINYLLPVHHQHYKQTEALHPKLWEPDGTGTRIFGNETHSEINMRQLQKLPARNIKGTGARPKVTHLESQGHLDSRQREEMKTQSSLDRDSRQDNTEEEVLIKAIKRLNI